MTAAKGGAAAKKVTAAKKGSAAALDVPAELSAALAANPLARGYFEKMPPSHRREYAQHVGEAKKAETRARRAEAAVGMIVKWGEGRG